MEYEAIVVELKIMAALQVGQRLTTKSAFLNLEPTSLIPEFVRRWKSGDNRNEAVKKINVIINNALLNIHNPVMKEYLRHAVVGIKNLQQTYSTDVQTVSRLDVIIDKINLLIDEKIITEN